MLARNLDDPSGAIMSRLSRTLLLSSLIVVFIGQTRAADEKMLTTPYYPLVVGNSWLYRVGENHFTLKVAKLEEVGDKKKTTCARVEMIVNNKPVSFEHLAVTSDALVRYTFEGKEANPPIPFLKLPPKKGATWNIESRVDGQLLKGTFTAGEEETTVPMAISMTNPTGKMKTVTVTGKDIDVNGVKMNLTYYFAEKIGMVKQVIEYAGQKAVIELEKFEPAKS
jgi:hypothetical protein